MKIKTNSKTLRLAITVNPSRLADILLDLDNKVDGDFCISQGVRIGTFGNKAVILTVMRDDKFCPQKSRKFTSVTKKLTVKRKEG